VTVIGRAMWLVAWDLDSRVNPGARRRFYRMLKQRLDGAGGKAEMPVASLLITSDKELALLVLHDAKELGRVVFYRVITGDVE